MYAPVSVRVDSHDDLYVSDDGNNRVLFFLNPLDTSAPCPTPGEPGCAGDVIADAVFGQGTAGNDFSGTGHGDSATAMNTPLGLSLDSFNNLYVADSANNRVIEFNESLAGPPGNFIADIVYGQGAAGTGHALDTDTCHQKNPKPSATGMCETRAVAFDSNNRVYISDANNNRVLIFNPLATLTASPVALKFGNVDATGTSKPKKVTLTNKTATATLISSVTATPPFVIAGGADTCSDNTVGAAKTCSFDVEFAPATVANVSGGSIDVAYNGGSPAVALEGDGIAVTLTAPKSQSFAAVDAGAVGKPVSIALSNSSTVTVTLGTATLGVPDAASFTITSDGCSGQPLAPKGKCEVAVEFAPPAMASGAQTSTLSFGFTYGANNGGVSTALKGNVK